MMYCNSRYIFCDLYFVISIEVVIVQYLVMWWMLNKVQRAQTVLHPDNLLKRLILETLEDTFIVSNIILKCEIFAI